MPSEDLSFAQEGIFLALSKGDRYLYGYKFKRGLPVAIEAESLLSPRLNATKMFGTLLEAKVVMERWRREYNHIRPHSSLGYGLLPERSLSRWERRCSVPLRCTPTHRG